MSISDSDFDEVLSDIADDQASVLSDMEDPVDDLLSCVVEPQTPLVAAAPVVALTPLVKKPTVAAKKGASAVPKPALEIKSALETKSAVDATATELAAKFKLSNIKDAAKDKGMWAGALKPVIIPDLIGAVEVDKVKAEPAEAAPVEDGAPPDEGAAPVTVKVLTIVDIGRAHTPALLKIADEIEVNAADHAKEHMTGPASKRVTQIDTTFDPATGEISVYNDGPGIPVVPHEEATRQAGRKVYVPEVAFSWFLAGTNTKKDVTNVKGGTNGLGAKLANVHSVRFRVETHDALTQQSYSQEWRDRLEVTGPAIVRPLPKGTAPSTRVTFVPAYAALGYKVTAAGAPAGPEAGDLDAWLRLRAHQTAAYLGPTVKVTYNGRRCETTSVAKLGSLLATALGEAAGEALVLTATAKATVEPWKPHPWNIAVIVLPVGKKAARRATAQNMTIVNGVLSNKGHHVAHLKRLLSDAVEDKLRRVQKRGRAPAKGSAAAAVLAGAKGAAPKVVADKKMSVTETLGGVRLVMCGAMPGADWSGQRKDELQVEKAAVEHYSLPATFLRQVGDVVAERILEAQGSSAARGVVHTKYTRARHAGKASRAQASLCAAEGDSAIRMLRTGLTQVRGAAAPGSPTLDWYGIISLQGVITNAMRETKELETASGALLQVQSASLQNNVRLRALADAFGLRYNRKYETAEELATLNYGRLILCVDQDHDGIGKIAPLVLAWLYTFWPALLRTGRVCRLMTPLVRAYPKRGGRPAEFYYTREFEDWLAADPTRAEAHRIKYYKGLATHDTDEVKSMFVPAVLERSIFRYTEDEGAAALFRAYYGAAAAPRKAELLTPVVYPTAAEAAEMRARRELPLARQQLRVDAKAYKNDALRRQLPGAVDGLNPARRKVLMGAVRRFAGEAAAKELKVFQLGGYVADKCMYHHGDASLNGTITTMAQAFAGAQKYPYLVGVGMFGSRHGDEAGSARYIAVRLSPLVAAVFPPEDRWHLPYEFEDGERAEPRWYAPVVPMAALESYKIVSEGWNHASFGRDLDAVLGVVEAYIAGDPALLEAADALAAAPHSAAALALARSQAGRWALPACRRDFDGEVRLLRGVPHSFGRYEWDAAARTATVTELPMRVDTATYLKTLVGPGKNGAPNPRAAYIEEVADRSPDDRVRLEVRLRAGAFEQIAEAFGDTQIDPLEDALLLRASLRPHLNYYGADGSTLEFGDNYLAAILYWAPRRRAVYAARLERARLQLALKIAVEEQTARYVPIAAELDLARVEDDDAAAAALRARGFPVFDVALLASPEYTPNEALHDLVTAGPKASHAYLLDLRERDLVESAAAKRTKRLDTLRAELARVEAQQAERPTPGASVWRAEIAAFREVVARGVASGWTFKKKGAKDEAPAE